MSKSLSIFLIILLSALAIGITSLFILLLNGKIDISIFSIGFGSEYSKKLIESKEYDSIEGMNIECNTADITIEETSNSKIIVELYSEDAKEHSITEEDNKSIIKLNSNNKQMKIFRKADRVLIKIPKNFSNEININTNVGDVKVDSFKDLILNIKGNTGDIKIEEANDITAELNTGDIKINQAENINAKVVTGDVKIEKADNIYISNNTGDISIEKVNKKVEITGTTGDIKINNANIQENSYIKNKTGDIKINTLTGAYAEASTNVGDTKIKNQDRKSDIVIDITNNIGDIKIN